MPSDASLQALCPSTACAAGYRYLPWIASLRYGSQVALAGCATATIFCSTYPHLPPPPPSLPTHSPCSPLGRLHHIKHLPTPVGMWTVSMPPHTPSAHLPPAPAHLLAGSTVVHHPGQGHQRLQVAGGQAQHRLQLLPSSCIVAWQGRIARDTFIYVVPCVRCVINCCSNVVCY